MDPYTALLGFFAQLSAFFIQKDSLPEANALRGLSPVSLLTAALEQERTVVFFCPRLLPWLKLQESPLEHCPFAFH